MTPEQRVLRAKVAAHARWSRTSDTSAATRAARDKFDARFERQVDPDGVLPAEERARRVASARKAYFAGLALKSSAARTQRKSA